jgi:eukaryotic-like serine/threonine-protein kinase
VNHLPQLGARESAKLAPADKIDLVCDEFEAAWTRGETPRIEDFLDRCDAPVRELLLAELLLVDREFRIKRGGSASRREYQHRFPDYSTVIDGLEFATIDDRVGRSSSAFRARSAPVSAGKLAHFELLEELGSGASGTVWKARDTRLRRIVAVKIPRQERLSGPERERFLREGQACAQLRHPNIVAVHEVGEERGRVFIVAEFIDGVNLREWLNQNRPKPREAAELAAQLAEALHHAHELGVIHRDLKPANVLIDSTGRPHITDFGLAKWTTDSAGMTVEGNILGTPAYMSPEQARGNAGNVDRRTDVYGLGALLYELLTGQPPFQGDMAAVVHQVVHDEVRAPRRITSTIPRDLETICLKAMDKEPSRRYPSAQEMAVDLRRYLRGEPILARRTSLTEKSWRWLRRHPAAAVSILLAIGVAVAAVAITSLKNENYALQGYRSVEIDTDPAGARVAMVPIDDRTGEPSTDASSVLLPGGLTPLRISLKPGDYFVEACLPNEVGPPDFAEAYRTVPNGVLSKRQMQLNRQRGDAEELVRINVAILRASDVLKGMIVVPVAEKYRIKNPLLPKVLFVDSRETRPSDNPIEKTPSQPAEPAGESSVEITLADAKHLAELRGKRLPSASEYDAILEYVRGHRLSNASDDDATDPDSFGGYPEWTTTKYDFVGLGSSAALTALRAMYVLKGNGDSAEISGLLRLPDGTLVASPENNSPMIGFRGVHSASPRFLEW